MRQKNTSVIWNCFRRLSVSATPIILALILVTTTATGILGASSSSTLSDSLPVLERGEAPSLTAVVRSNAGTSPLASLREGRDSRTAGNDGTDSCHAIAPVFSPHSEVLRESRFGLSIFLFLTKRHLSHPISRAPPPLF